MWRACASVRNSGDALVRSAAPALPSRAPTPKAAAPAAILNNMRREGAHTLDDVTISPSLFLATSASPRQSCAH
jgi:hypothetical protein